MDAKSLAKLIIQLFAFYTLWSSITQLPMLTMAVKASPNDYSKSTAVIVLLMILGPILLALALWKFSGPIAILIVGTPSPESSEPLQTTANHCHARNRNFNCWPSHGFMEVAKITITSTAQLQPK